MNDFIIGGIVGVTQTTIGHPLDTIKVLMQNNKSWYGLGLRNYYRGLSYPLLGSITFNSFSFSLFNYNLKYIKSETISGVISGIFISPLVFSFDVGKIKRQTNVKLKLKNFIKNKGFYSTLAREAIGNGSYFGLYFYCKNKLELPIFISGGIAGIVNWTITYPLDTIRSRQISNNISIKNALKMGNLWKGYSACLIRAFVVNSSSFYVYELCKKKLI
jgi:solute carrier family 25 (mitochondrial carnitine/acylcarnitine transporter), member 20/29